MADPNSKASSSRLRLRSTSGRRAAGAKAAASPRPQQPPETPAPAAPAASAEKVIRPPAATSPRETQPFRAASPQPEPSVPPKEEPAQAKSATAVKLRSAPARRKTAASPSPARRWLVFLCFFLLLLTVAMVIAVILVSRANLSGAAEPAGTEEPVAVTALDETGTEPVVKDRLPQNVTIAGVDVGGKSGSAAVAAVEAAAAQAFAQDLTLTFPDRTLVLEAAQLQAVLDASAAVAQAQAWEGDDETTLLLPGTLTVNSEYLHAQLQAVADAVYVASQDPGVSFADNWLFLTIGADGLKLDVDLAVQAIMTALSLGNTSDISLTYTVIPAQKLDMQALYNQYCTDPINAFYDETAGEIVRGQVGYQFDVAAAQALVDAAKAGETIAVQLVETNPEITYSFLASLGSMAELASYSREAMGKDAPEPATYEGFPDELGAYSTEYSNNPNRTNNLIRACNIINGTVLKPGQQFSFNAVVGERTVEKGFKEAVAYVGGENVNEVGGGVCQVATTIYNAALLANLQIDLRNAHIYESHYCEQGLDATVSWPNPNFQFTNNTENPIYIEANVSGGYVNIRLMGTKTDDTYVVMTSQQTGAVDYYQTIYRADSTLSLNESAVYQGGSNGYSVTTYRNVYAGDGTLISSAVEAYSTYQRRDRIVLVSSNSPYLD